MAAGAVEFRVLGTIQVVSGGAARPVAGPKPRTLLAVLLLAAPHPVSVTRLLAELWAEEAPATALTALQMHVLTLRRLLPGRLRTLSAAYALDMAGAEVDATRFEALAAAGRAQLAEDPARAAGSLVEALSLWRGDAFSDVPRTASVDAAAARLEEARLAALEDRVEADLALGRHAELVTELVGLAEAHPTRERLVGLLMLGLHRAGRSADALRVYSRLGAALDSELGVDPGDSVVALEKAIRRGDPTLAPASPASLPAPADAFVGRRRELDESARLLAGTRMLTLTGPGGCGKSRLALELARASAPADPGGVHLVELAPLAPGASVARRAAAVLDVRERQDAPIDELVAQHLRHRRALLLLDNCEHMAASSARFCTEVLQRCPGVRILATSREPLGVAGEVVWPVPSLALAGPGASLAEIEACDAVKLLVERARGARPGLPMDRDELRLAAQICARLDGLPLAIELAAARLRTFSTKELAGLLEGGLDVLGAGGPGAEPRHRTLRAAIEWSYQLLEEPERAAFRRFSVLRGGGDLEAALAVCADPEGPPPRDPQQATGALVRLVDRSLLSPAPGGQGTRYRMLELVREYAAERLVESGEEADTRARQADWYSRSVTGSHARPGHHAGQWAKRLDTEHDNLRAALTWYLGEGQDPERARDTAAALWRHWWGRGMMSEGREWLRRSLAGGRQEPSPGRVRALRAAAVLARHMHDHDEARRLGGEALEAARAIGDEAAYPACLNGLCATAHVQGDLDASLRFGEESVAWAERLGDRRGVAAAYANLATTLRGLGRLQESEVIYLRALSTFRQSRDRFSEAVVLNNLAQVARRLEQPARSRDLARQALAVYQELQFVDGELDILGLLACLEVDEGRPEAGLRTLAVTERERQRTGYRVQLAADREARGRALAAATLALGEDGARAVRAAAAAADVDDLVAEFLAGTPGHVDDVGPPSRGRGTPRPYLKPEENWVRTKYRWNTT